MTFDILNLSTQANPPSFDRCEDLAALLYLNESSVMHSLRQRYGGNLIHTHAGPNMVIINPISAPSMYSEKVRALVVIFYTPRIQISLLLYFIVSEYRIFIKQRVGNTHITT